MQNVCTLLHTYANCMQTGLIFYLLAYALMCLGFAGPTWRSREGSVLVASRRFDGSRSRKTKGSLADMLQCNIWRRAQTPHRMTHSLHGGANHGKFNGFAALGKAIGT